MNRVSAIASKTRFPRTASTTSRAFRGETRTPVTLARTSIVVPISPPPLAPTATVGVFTMTAEGSRGRELTEFVPDHLLRDEDRDVNFAIVHGHRVTNHARKDRRRPRPGADDPPLVRTIERIDLFLQFGVDIWPLLGRPRHEMPPRLLPLRGATSDNHRVRALVIAGARLHRLSPFGLGLASDGGLALTAAMRMVARVHRRPADGWTPPTMPVPTRFSDHDILVIDVADLSQGRTAVEVNEPYFSRRHPDLCVVFRLCHQLGRRSGGAAQLTAFARIQFNIVDLRAGGNVAQRHGV